MKGSRPVGVNCSCFSWYMGHLAVACKGGKATEQFRPFLFYQLMKQLYLKTLVLLLMSIAGADAFAYDCVVDGIYYRLNQEKKTASVTNKNGYQEESYSGHLVIPAEITYEGITYSVTEIGDVAFGGSKNLTGLTIGRNINRIYTMDLFANASGLTNIIVDSENQTFDSRDNCNAVIETKTNTLVLGSKNTVIPNSVTAIGAGAFHGCKVLTNITIPNSITSIGSFALGECTGLTSITIPNSVTAIGRSAFSGCTGLTNMIIPNSVTYVGEYNQEIKGETNVEIIPVSA